MTQTSLNYHFCISLAESPLVFLHLLVHLLVQVSFFTSFMSWEWFESRPLRYKKLPSSYSTTFDLAFLDTYVMFSLLFCTLKLRTVLRQSLTSFLFWSTLWRARGQWLQLKKWPNYNSFLFGMKLDELLSSSTVKGWPWLSWFPSCLKLPLCRKGSKKKNWFRQRQKW